MNEKTKLLSEIKAAQEALAEAGTGTYRAELDKKFHFIPLNLAVLDITLGSYLINDGDPDKAYTVSDLRQDIIKYLKKHSSGIIITPTPEGFVIFPNTPISTTELRRHASTGVLIQENGQIKGVLYSRFVAARDNLFTQFLNTELRSKFVNKLDVGHVVFQKTEELGSSPQALKAVQAYTRVLNASREFLPVATRTQANVLNRLLTNMQKQISNFEVHTTYSKKIENSLSKNFSYSLLSIKANIVIIQDQKENRHDFTPHEKEYKDRLIEVFIEYAPGQKFSRSLLEEIEYRVASALKGKKATNTSRVIKESSSIKGTPKAARPRTSSPGTVPTAKVINLETKRAIGLPRLLALLNNHLQDVVSANMQDPDDYDKGSRKLLTYRTGRFAESVKVERLSASREGAITAFYSYMKNPYATFSAGGRQQNPRSRDPKSLISRSIREIAAKYVAEQMRAVNV